MDGTFLNGVRLKYGARYELLENDVIEFANEEKYVFYKTKQKEEEEYPVSKVKKEKEEERSVNKEKGEEEEKCSVEKTKEEEQKMENDNWIDKEIKGTYILRSLIGESPSEKVYLATNSIYRRFVVKSIEKSTQNYDRIYGETTLLQRLDHPYIEKVFDKIEDETHDFIILEYVDGINLEKLAVESGGVLPVEKVLKYAIQIAEALEYMHSMNPPIIHRDIKPQNIGIDNNDNVKLIDFGIAMEYYPDKTDCYILGTKGYAAPEQYYGATTPKSDMYALGMLMYRLLTGVNPCEESGVIIPIRKYNEKYTKELEMIVGKCISTKQEERFANDSELIKALKKEQGKIDKKTIFKNLRK